MLRGEVQGSQIRCCRVFEREIMARTVKTTKIEKKFKNKKGEESSITINFAKVVDRLNEFRTQNPRGLIDTSYVIDGDKLVFKTRILKDKSDQFSAEATGHAFAKNNGSEKLFEKLETISVGRALALLGYAAGGEIASSEEMDDFASFRDEKIDERIEVMQKCSTLTELREYFMSLGSYMSQSRIIEAKDKRKAELSE
jgi:hypothetical protein